MAYGRPADMSAQGVFNKVAEHMMSQGVRCQREGTGCVYRSGKMACAAGCLLTDEEAEGLDGPFAENWCAVCPEDLLGTKRLVESLQNAHDRGAPGNWEARLRSIAEDYELSADVLATPEATPQGGE